MMKRGGFRTEVKSKKETQCSFNTFALNIIKECIVDALPPLSMKHIRQSAGGKDFQDAFTTWLKIFADPFHDFAQHTDLKQMARDNPFHSGFIEKQDVSQTILVRTYHDLLLSHQAKVFEPGVLVRLLQDMNGPHGISLKYTRFYVKQKEATKDTAPDLKTWETIEDNFDHLGDTTKKYYIMNAPIKQVRTSILSHNYQKIVPLAAYWDSVKASSSGINFQINDATFYDALYENVNRELFVGTGIKLRIHETNDNKVVKVTVTSNTDVTKVFLLDRIGYPIKDLRDAIICVNEQRINDINEDKLRHMVLFLKKNGASSTDLISFLLTCKMSGDAGVVEFVKQINRFSGIAQVNGKEETFLDRDRTLVFVITGDSLCAANAIANDVMVVFNFKTSVYVQDEDANVYFAQYLGSGAAFDMDAFLEPYYDGIDAAVGMIETHRKHYSFRDLPSEQKVIDIQGIYHALFKTVFVDVPHNPMITWTPSRSQSSPLDMFVRCVIAVNQLTTFRSDFDDAIDYIIRVHFKKHKVSRQVINFHNLQSLYTFYDSSRFFDPLLMFFKDVLVIPNAQLQHAMYNYLQSELQKRLRISLTTNVEIINAMLDPSGPPQVYLPQDSGMIDAPHPSHS